MWGLLEDEEETVETLMTVDIVKTVEIVRGCNLQRSLKLLAWNRDQWATPL